MRRARPRVSIGVPVFNGERYLAGALDSILDQTYEDFEVLVCDNASTDATAEICSRYVARDGRIRYWRNAENIGAHRNFQSVLALASADFFTWTCADDVRPPGALQALVETLRQHPDAVMAYGPVLFTLDGQPPSGRVTNEMAIAGADPAARVRTFTRRLTSSVMLYGLYRRSEAARAVFGRHLGADYLYCLRMCFLGPLAYTPTPMLIFRCRVHAATGNPMYGDLPLTVRNLVRPGGVRRKKCWTVLFMGCYYIAASPGTRLTDRVTGIVAHVWAFCVRYRGYLAKEAVYVALVSPVLWFAALPSVFSRKLGRLLRRTATAGRLAR